MAIPRTVTLAVVIVLFLVAFFGDDGVFVMTPADVHVSEFVFTHTRPGPLMTLTDYFPEPIGADFDKYPSVNSLLGSGYPGATRLDPADVSLLTTYIAPTAVE